MTRVRVSVFINRCSTATKLASGLSVVSLLTNKAGSTRQVHRSVRPVSEKTEDYLGLFVSFGFTYLEQSHRYLGIKITFQRCQVLCHKYYWNLQACHRADMSSTKGFRHLHLNLSYLPLSVYF